jgi:hypothetical protein
MAAAQALARLYAAARLHTHPFQASFKLKEKKRIGARVIKRYHPPAPPRIACWRMHRSRTKTRTGCGKLQDGPTPVALLAEIHAAQADSASVSIVAKQSLCRRGRSLPVSTACRQPQDVEHRGPLWY